MTLSLSFEQKLQNYADLAVRVGVNLQAGQRLIVRAGGKRVVGAPDCRQGLSGRGQAG